jgi:hypothetical protein
MSLRIFFFFFLVTCKLLWSDIQQISSQQIDLSGYLLPQNHPLQEKLDTLFEDPNMFKSHQNVKQAGFHVVYNKYKPNTKLMVIKHPALENYLIKKFVDKISRRQQLRNYVSRIKGAKALRKFIKVNNLQHIVVPQKWLYELPEQFSDIKTKEKGYLLIEDNMDICSGGLSSKGEVARKYKTIEFDILDELCLVVYNFRGLDSAMNNLPFTKQNKIAFVDTEHWKSKKGKKYLRKIKPYMSEDRREHALNLFQKLNEQEMIKSE